jgi:hypothetical protein
MLDDRGIAQGGLIDTRDGKWYAYLFKDNGAVGRVSYLVPVTCNGNGHSLTSMKMIRRFGEIGNCE